MLIISPKKYIKIPTPDETSNPNSQDSTFHHQLLARSERAHHHTRKFLFFYSIFNSSLNQLKIRETGCAFTLIFHPKIFSSDVLSNLRALRIPTSTEKSDDIILWSTCVLKQQQQQNKNFQIICRLTSTKKLEDSRCAFRELLLEKKNLMEPVS